MQKTAITRRKLVKTLLALGAGGVSLSPLAGGRKVWAFLGGEPPSLETFSAVSTFVTLHDDLDPGAVARMYKVFMDEPWGPEHIAGIYKKVTQALKDKKRAPLKDKSWQFTEGEAWFAGHLLTTWYLGIYYHERTTPKRILYADSLLMRATSDVLPVPYLEPVGFGAWAQPPGEKE
jgi:hypothetical protein